MKILHILNSLEYSGAEMMILNSVKEFKKKKINFYVLSNSNKPGPAQIEFIKKNIEVINLNLNYKKNYIKLYNLLKKKNIDKVHIHTEANFFKLYLISALAGIKKIFRTIHSIFNPGFILKLRRKLIFYMSDKLNVKLISVSDCVKKNELVHFNNKTLQIYNYFDQKKFKYVNQKNRAAAKKKIGINPNTLVLSLIGNCSDTKNHMLVIDAFKNLKNKDDFFLIHVGDEGKNKNEKKKVFKENLEKYFKFYGNIKNWQIVCAASDIIINSSKKEGLGNSTLEACSMGMLPILTKVHGNNTILKKIRNSISINNSRDLTKILTLILSKKNKIITEAKSFRISNEVIKTFNKKNYIKKHMNIYENF